MSVCKKSIHERALRKRNLCVLKEQDSQFPGSQWVMVHQDKKKDLFHRLSWKRLYPLWLQVTKYLEDYNV